MTVTAPKGFSAAGVAAGLKSSGDPDVAVVLNHGPDDAAAAVFTTNRFPAAPVLWSRQVLAGERARAVVLNSGGANACTGPEGFQDTHATAEHAAKELGIGAIDVAVASTGLIGVRLPMDKLTAGITAAVKALSEDGGPDAARAIMTTDSVPKTTVQARGGPEGGWTVGGMAKGAGMLAPSLATMLVVLTTDAVVPPDMLRPALKQATNQSFERVDSDGCLSTNDTVIVMSSGASGITPSAEEFTEALTAAATDLAMQLLADAEGSTKDIAITVRNAASVEDALTAGRACARNNLLKTALFGNDPNWGRVLAAIGTTDAAFEADQVDVTINGVTVCRGGAIGDPREGVDLTGRAVTIDVDLRAGTEQGTIWTNDLSIAYVHENSAYST
ncbi:bifunctional glutamate N-acetyltransferase/amino-acid acetyltransferase ArgJ [Blastococcus sp. PRF04-17]|uniref:bifunctional glutamate N-acetyltransferase/amino-acid acetyltransferase ArgJ n=1 Tax=Blastococcus sp. PRF04-17 TaxID=2933797 RepID=UPI001FF1BA7D|nr:bifunctional glutamate N-acetyltransferase/amino-acid acetyltransferase ArgJ [Blastococcus sp. PRF04-17]UOY02670.1 bifunctional glutamate N-acetyltransferase/amino-acid acetyltransferase ArgJ [Blastococcus sp. PRF04-17]